MLGLITCRFALLKDVKSLIEPMRADTNGSNTSCRPTVSGGNVLTDATEYFVHQKTSACILTKRIPPLQMINLTI
jgi:hypothetical protein